MKVLILIGIIAKSVATNHVTKKICRRQGKENRAGTAWRTVLHTMAASR